MKGLAIAYLCLGCVVLGALVSSAEPAESVEAAAPVVINGDPVSAEEFEWFMQLERATVIDHVKTEFNLDYGDAFWSRECGETTPKGMLQARVLVRVRRDKVLCKLAGGVAVFIFLFILFAIPKAPWPHGPTCR